MFIENRGVVPKQRDSRRAVSAVMPRFLINNVVDGRRRHPQRLGQLVRRHAERRQELFAEDFSRVNGGLPAHKPSYPRGNRRNPF